jgi:hypothetical protein
VRWARCDRSGARVTFGVVSASSSFQNRASLHLVNVDGSGLVTLVDDKVTNEYPVFHPDGRSVLFSSARGGGTNIFELSLADGTVRTITNGNFDCAPAVTPDGKTLVFNSDTTSLPLFAYDADGSRRQLTHTLADFEWPVASADGRELFAVARRGGKSEVRAIALDDGSERVLTEGDTPALDGSEEIVWLSVGDGAGARVVAVPRAGGEPRLMARLPAPLRRLVRGGDGAMHASVIGARGDEAWSLPPAGEPRREALAPYTLVVPAPMGGWRLAELARGAATEVELIAPAATLGAAGNRRLPLRGSIWQADGRALIAWDGAQIVRVFVDGGQEPMHKTVDFTGLAVAADGKTIYAGEVLGHVRRELLLNFADRPR